jgi:hypothetical protein
MKQESYIQLYRNEKTETLLKQYPKAFLLLTQIALRARRTPCVMQNLKVNECKIGDHKNCGLTQKEYRTAKSKLVAFSFCSFKGTSKGTIATLLNSNIYNINANTKGEQGANKGRTRGEQGATNNNDKKDNNDNNDNKLNDFSLFWNKYHEVTNKPKTDKVATEKYWNKLNTDEKQKAFDNIKSYSETSSDKTYLKKARTYLSDKNFNDEMKADNTGSAFTYKKHIEENKNEAHIQAYNYFLNLIEAKRSFKSPIPDKFFGLEKPFTYQQFEEMIDWDNFNKFDYELKKRKIKNVAMTMQFETYKELIANLTFGFNKYTR